MPDIDLELIKKVIEQINEDADDKDYTAIENLFQFLDYPEKRLKGFLKDN